MENNYFAFKGARLIINDVLFDTTNEIKVYRKDKKIYLECNQEVFNENQLNEIKNLLNTSIFESLKYNVREENTISVLFDTIDTSGKKGNLKIDFICLITNDDKELFKCNFEEVVNMNLRFEVLRVDEVLRVG